MQKAINSVMQAIDPAATVAPEWVQLLPAAAFTGVDGRGPYMAPDAQALVALFNEQGRKLPIDENHSIDLKGAKGEPSPARGWIVALQARDSGIWGKAEWTAEGKALIESKAYGYLSPVFMHTVQRPFRIGVINGVSLVNQPNIQSLKSLHHARKESEMLEELRKVFGLPETADEAAVLDQVKAAHLAQTSHVALMARLVTVAGVAADAAPDALVTALQAKTTAAATTDSAEVAGLQDQLKSLQAQLTTVVTTSAKDRAETAITTAIQEGKIVPALKEHMIARHMKDPAEVEKEIKLLPSLNGGGLGGRQLPDNGGVMTREDDQIMAMMGVDPKAYAETAKALHGKGN